MKAIGTCFALAVVAAVCSAAAHADVKAVEKVTIDSPQLNALLESASPAQREKFRQLGLAREMVVTIYTKGNKQRTDLGSTSVITNLDAHTTVTINRGNKTISTSPIDPEILKQQMTGTTTRITPTSKTMVILGHVAHLAKMTSVNAAQGVKTYGEIWSAPDIPGPKSNPFATQMGGVNMTEIAKIKGFPLKVKLTTTGGYTGKTTISAVATALSTNPLPSKTFAIPTGYRPGGPAFPMGGGMGAVR